jgi:hypothetical protein
MRAQFDSRRVATERKKSEKRKERYKKPLERIWAPPVSPPSSTESSAKGPRFEARNKRIRWLVKNKWRLRNHIHKGTLRDLIREMKALGLYAKSTATVDIEMGFPNLIFCVEQAIGDQIFASSSPTKQDPILYRLHGGRSNVGIIGQQTTTED